MFWGKNHQGVADRGGRGLGVENPMDVISEEIHRAREAVPFTLRETADPFVRKLQYLGLMLPDCVLEPEISKIEAAIKKFESVVAAFQMGFEPTIPNEQWFCGFINHEVAGIRDTNRLFPCANWKLDGYSGGPIPEALVFRGIIPAVVQQKYLQASDIFGERGIRVYAPSDDAFERARVKKNVNMSSDPVMIGLIENVPDSGNLFFEIARWDTGRDLEAIGMRTI